MVIEDPALKQDDRYFLSSEEAFDVAMGKSVRYIELRRGGDIISDRADSYFFKS